MAQASLKTTLVDCLARRLVKLNLDYQQYPDPPGSWRIAADPPEKWSHVAGIAAELWAVARLCNVEPEVEVMIAKLAAANAKEAS